jgi:hypothetical protein
MYIETVPNRGSRPAILLRESYRDGGKVKKRTLLNLTDFPTEIVEGFGAVLKGGKFAPKADESPSSCAARCRTVMSPSCSAPCARLASIACSALSAIARASLSSP